MLNSCEDLERTVQNMGFLPFFKNAIEGFSIEEMTPPTRWFSDEYDGPWEWKGPVIRQGNCAYGKLFCGKAGYVSLDKYPDFLNMRRSGYIMSPDEKRVYDLLVAHESLLSKELKKLGGFKRSLAKSRNPIDLLVKTPVVHKNKTEGFETIMTRLQMHCYVVIADFEYDYTHDGRRYGWGIARYTTPEALFGDEIIRKSTYSSPEKSKEYLLEYLKQLLPQADESAILKIIQA